MSSREKIFYVLSVPRGRPGGGEMAENSQLVDANELAKLLGVTPRTIRNLAADEDISFVKQGSKRMFDAPTAIQEFIALSAKRASGGLSDEERDLEKEKLQADVDYKRAKADTAELMLEELRGNMHSSEDVEHMTADLILMVKSLLLALPGQMAVDLAQIDNPTEVSAKLREAAAQMLAEISRYEYNPDKYRKRVRERRGMSDEDDAEDRG